jgi:hypothetical protein
MSRIARTLACLVLGALGLAAALPNTAAAIVNGTRVPASTYPWFATIGPLTRPGAPAQYCSGAVISSRQVLTSAACGWHTWAGTGKVFVGGRWIGITDITVHPLWNGSAGSGHDLALVRLASTADVTPLAVGAPWDPGATAHGTPATIVSRTWDSAPAPAALDVAAVAVHDDDAMVAAYGAPPGPFEEPIDWNPPFMVGVGQVLERGGREPNACADHGSPAVVRSRQRDVLIGVASFSFTGLLPCTQPGGFAELTGPQLAWVAQRVPSITDAWGPCRTAAGDVGRTSVGYLSTFAFNTIPEGPFWWHLRCDDAPPPPEPVEPEPAPAPDPADPPLCRRPLRLCEL